MYIYVISYCFSPNVIRGNLFIVLHSQAEYKQDLCYFPLHCVDQGLFNAPHTDLHQLKNTKLLSNVESHWSFLVPP